MGYRTLQCWSCCACIAHHLATHGSQLSFCCSAAAAAAVCVLKRASSTAAAPGLLTVAVHQADHLQLVVWGEADPLQLFLLLLLLLGLLGGLLLGLLLWLLLGLLLDLAAAQTLRQECTAAVMQPGPSAAVCAGAIHAGTEHI